MATLRKTLKHAHEWAVGRINEIHEISGVNQHELDNAYSIYEEFSEWIDPSAKEHDIISLEYIGEGSDY